MCPGGHSKQKGAPCGILIQTLRAGEIYFLTSLLLLNLHCKLIQLLTPNFSEMYDSDFGLILARTWPFTIRSIAISDVKLASTWLTIKFRGQKNSMRYVLFVSSNYFIFKNDKMLYTSLQQNHLPLCKVQPCATGILILERK